MPGKNAESPTDMKRIRLMHRTVPEQAVSRPALGEQSADHVGSSYAGVGSTASDRACRVVDSDSVLVLKAADHCQEAALFGSSPWCQHRDDGLTAFRAAAAGQADGYEEDEHQQQDAASRFMLVIATPGIHPGGA